MSVKRPACNIVLYEALIQSVFIEMAVLCAVYFCIYVRHITACNVVLCGALIRYVFIEMAALCDVCFNIYVSHRTACNVVLYEAFKAENP